MTKDINCTCNKNDRGRKSPERRKLGNSMKQMRQRVSRFFKAVDEGERMFWWAKVSRRTVAVQSMLVKFDELPDEPPICVVHQPKVQIPFSKLRQLYAEELDRLLPKLAPFYLEFRDVPGDYGYAEESYQSFLKSQRLAKK